MPSVNIGTYSFVGNHTSNSSISSATVITVPANANGVLLQALTQNVRAKFDGNDPSASDGFQIKADDPASLYPVGEGKSFKVIQETATANIQYQFVRTY